MTEPNKKGRFKDGSGNQRHDDSVVFFFFFVFHEKRRSFLEAFSCTLPVEECNESNTRISARYHGKLFRVSKFIIL